MLEHNIRTWRRFAALTITSGLAGALALGCTTTGGEDELPPNAIPIAALVDQTGTSATLAFSGTIKLAFKQMNEGLRMSGLGDIQFRLMLRDTASRTDLAVRHAREAVESGARALITEISADTSAVNDLNYGDNPLGVPINCFACSSSFINNPLAIDMNPVRQAALRDERNYIHRLFFNSKFEAAVQMHVALSRGTAGDRNGDGHFKVALIATDDPYGRGWGPALRTKMTDMHPWKWLAPGVTIGQTKSVEVMYIDPKVNDSSYNWNADLSKLVDKRNDDQNEAIANIADGEPDTVFLALLPVGSGAVTKALREAGNTIPLQATTAFRRLHVLRSLGAAAEGVEGGSPRKAADKSGEDFEAAFHREYGEEPEMLSSGAYDCAVTHMLAALVAIGTGGDPNTVTPDAIRTSLDRINDPDGVVVGVGPEEFARAADVLRAGGTINYRGPTGDTTFDKYGNTFPVMVHYKVVGRRFEEVTRYTCDEDRPTCVEVVQ